MSTWEERMAIRSAQLRKPEEDRRAAEDAAEEAERERLIGPWAAFVEERGGYFPSVGIHSVVGDHRGHYAHGHYFHGNGIVCSCGDLLGIFSVALTGDEPPPPDECPVCRDFPQFAGTGLRP